jgi:hypothetical protein
MEKSIVRTFINIFVSTFVGIFISSLLMLILILWASLPEYFILIKAGEISLSELIKEVISLLSSPGIEALASLHFLSDIAWISLPGAAIGTLGAAVLFCLLSYYGVGMESRIINTLLGGGIGAFSSGIAAVVYSIVKLVITEMSPPTLGGEYIFLILLLIIFVVITAGAISGLAYGLLYNQKAKEVS